LADDSNEEANTTPVLSKDEEKTVKIESPEEVTSAASDVMARLQTRTQAPTKSKNEDPMEILRRIKEKQGMAQ